MSNLLMQGEFAAFFPALAKTLQDAQPEGKRTGGVEQAIVLQMLQFRLSGPHSTKEINGELWYAATWSIWQQTFPCWSDRKIRSTFYELREKNLVKIEERAKVNWFTIDYSALEDAGILAVSARSPGTDDQALSSTTRRRTEEELLEGSSDQDTAESGQEAAGGQQLALDGNQAVKSGGEGSDASPPTQPRRNLTREVWLVFKETMKPRRAEPDADDLKTINAALKVRDVELCKKAIHGCAASDWHMGRDSQTKGKKYNKLSQILKGKRGGKTTREMIDQFLEYAEKAERQSGVPSADSARIDRRKQEVRDMHAMAGDPTVVERGQKAEEWLRQLGITATVEWEEKGGIRRPIVRFHQD